MKLENIGNLTEINTDGIMRGIVVSNEDDKLEGRVALLIPKLALKFDPNIVEKVSFTLNNNKNIVGNTAVTNFIKDNVESVNYIWARPTAKNYMIPYVGEAVYCFMEDGDPNKVYWTRLKPTLDGEVTDMELVKNGSNKFDKARKPFIHVFEEFSDGTILYYDENENAKRLEAKFKSGFTINMNDTDTNKSTEVKTASGHNILMDDLAKSINIKTAGGHNILMSDNEKVIRIKSSGGHSVSLDDSGKQINIKTAGGHNILLNDNGNVISATVSGGAKVLITNTSVLLQSTGKGRLLVHPGGVSGN